MMNPWVWTRSYSWSNRIWDRKNEYHFTINIICYSKRRIATSVEVEDQTNDEWIIDWHPSLHHTHTHTPWGGEDSSTPRENDRGETTQRRKVLLEVCISFLPPLLLFIGKVALGDGHAHKKIGVAKLVTGDTWWLEMRGPTLGPKVCIGVYTVCVPHLCRVVGPGKHVLSPHWLRGCFFTW